MIILAEFVEELLSQLVRPGFLNDRVHIDHHHVEEVLGELFQDSIRHRSVHADAIHFLNLGLLLHYLPLHDALDILSCNSLLNRLFLS